MECHQHTRSCSCTSCVYRSRSKQPNIQQLLQDGSDIDRLYLGKFLPLRERKLLEKLIRTRDVYDDVRNQLLSSSEQSIRKHKKARRDADLSPEQSSAVIKMIDIVDRRGYKGTPNASNSCCSYCDCRTLSKIRKRMAKEDKKHPKVHRQIVTCEDIGKYCEEAAKKGRKRRNKLSSKLSSKIGSARMKIKKNLSEPTVLSKSRAFVKRIRLKKERKTSDSASEVVSRDQKTKTAKLKRKKEKHIQSRISKDSATEVRNTLAEKIKKDSIILFKEKLLKKRPYEKNKHVECKPGICKAGTCSPEECLAMIHTKKVGDGRKRKPHSRHSETSWKKSRFSMRMRPKRVKERESQVQIAKTESSSSVSTLLKTKEIPSLSKSELREKVPSKPVKKKVGKALAEKSAASMTSVPELKTKGTKEEKGRKLKSKTTKRRHVAKDKHLTTKPATKSTSSFTSVPTEKVSKTRSKSIKTIEHHEGEPDSPLTRHKTGRQKPRREPHHDIEEVKYKKEHIEHVKTKEKDLTTKAATKSTSSFTSVLKEKILKTRSKSIKTTEYHEGEPDSPPTRHKKGRQKPRREPHHDIEEVKYKDEHKEHVKAKDKDLTTKAGTKSTSSFTSVPKEKVSKTRSKSIKTIEHHEGEPDSPPTRTKKGRQKPRREPHDLEEAKYKEEYVKAKDKDLTTKDATKSTSSFTSVPKEKTSKTRSRSIKTLGSHKGEPASPPTRHKTGRQKPRHEPHHIEEATYRDESIEHVKAKREKRIKPTHGRKQRQKYMHSKTQISGASAKSSKHSYLRDSGSQASKPLGRKVLSKSKSQGRSTMASMERLKRKSVGSAFSQKTSSRSRTKSKHKQSKSAENFTSKQKYTSEEPPPERDENIVECYPGRQAVKISSSFSFNIEFYKDTYPCVEVPEQPDFESSQTPRPRKKTKTHTRQTQHRKKIKDHGIGHVHSRHDMSSQSMSTQSFKSTQVAHKLKRCFCTQKLIQTKKHKFNYVESKQTMASVDTKEREVVAREIRTQTKLSGMAYVVPPSTSTQASLLPYECEPGICTPGECDPYECLERIKQRNRGAGKQVSRDTNTTEIPRKSKVASTSPSESKSTSSSENRKVKRKQKHTQNIVHSPEMEPLVSSSDTSGHRQAVRIGSNFNFNIEFSKTNINDRVTANALIYDRPIQMERRHMQPKGIKVYKPRVRHETSETTRINVKTKQTRTEPFLQRCLCTLKLLKKNKKKVEKLSPWRSRDEYVMHMQNRTENRYNPERSKLLPYEYEPGLCIPKEYHPYDCEKLIKLRHTKLKHKYSKINDLGSLSTFSKTSETTTTSSEFQNTLFPRRKSQQINKTNQHYNEINIISDRFKQRVMRDRSNLSSKIELAKEKSQHYKKKENSITEDLINKRTQNKHKTNRRKSPQLDPTHHTAKDTKAKLVEKKSSVLSVIKKCFSVLKFSRKSNKLELETKHKTISENMKIGHVSPSPQISEYKKTRGKSSKLPYDLSSHEGPPNVCSSGMCSPYERYEENKRRQIDKLEKPHVSTIRRERKSVRGVTSEFSVRTKTKHSRPTLLRHKTKEDQKLKNKQKYMKTARSFSPPRLAVFERSSKKSTNRAVPSSRDTSYRNRVEKLNTISNISTINEMRDKHYLSQETKFEKEPKASNIGFLLKKCFCKLGISKKNILQREFNWQQPITSQFVQVEHNNKKIKSYNVSKSRCNVLNEKFYAKEPLQSKLPDGGYVFKENLIESQYGLKKSRFKSSQNLPNSSFTRRNHIRSQIDINFDKMKNLLKIPSFNPFYRSFYALNVNVSKSDRKDVNSYHDDNPSYHKTRKREGGDCEPGQCDPRDCSKRYRRLKKLKKYTEEPPVPKVPCKDMPTSDCYERCKAEFQKEKKAPKKRGPDRPLILGSDFKIRAGVYKDTDPYKNSRKRAVRIGSDARFDLNFFKEPTRRNLCYTGPIPAAHLPKDRAMMESTSTFFRKGKPLQEQPNIYKPDKHRREDYRKPSGIKLMMKRFSRGKARLKRAARSDLSQRMDKYSDICGDPAKYKSTPRLPKRKETSKTKYVQCKECARPKKKSHIYPDKNNVTFCTDVNCLEFSKEEPQKRRASIVSRFTCLGGDQNKPVANLQRQGKGEGDVQKQYGPIEGNKTMIDKCLCALKKTKKTKNKCMCGAENVGKSGAKKKNKNKCLCKPEKGPITGAVQPLKEGEVSDSPQKCFCTRKKKLETRSEKQLKLCRDCGMQKEVRKRRKKKICRQLEEAEREMETIMPYSKRKYKKKRGSLSTLAKSDELVKPEKLAKSKQLAKSEQLVKSVQLAQSGQLVKPKYEHERRKNVCASKCRSIAKEAKIPGIGGIDGIDGIIGKGRKRGKRRKDKNALPDYDVRMTPSFECLCNKEARLRRLCPVCRAKAKGKFLPMKNKLPCTCMNEEIPPEKPKDLSKCPMCKETLKKKNKKAKKCPCCKKPFSLKSGEKGEKDGEPAVEIEPVDTTPRFEMMLNTTNMKIVNKEEVLKKIGQEGRQAAEKQQKALKTIKGHGRLCKCCICRGVQKGAEMLGAKHLSPEHMARPCICGSQVCKKDWDKIKQEQKALATVAGQLQKCICGSNICAEESSKMPEVLLEEARQAEHDKELAKRAIQKEKAYQKARKQRMKAQEAARREQERVRKEQDKAEMKSIKKSEGGGDIALIAESLIDLGTFGSKAFCDVAKTVFRAVLHPRDVVTDIRDAAADPSAAAKSFQRSVAQTGLFSTGARIKARMGKMPAARRALKEMENHQMTHYLVHMADKDPKKRTFNPKIKRKREPLDFECSLYMASMRKRPFLKIYYMCPWFYPHCMSCLGLWKQLMDVLLFILAVFLWSPCILCMELCRGFVCCVMCQG